MNISYTFFVCFFFQVMKCLLETEEPPAPELLALGINLACHFHNAQIMCQGPGLKLLMKKALNTQDSLLMKLIRNISQHKGEIKKLFLVCTCLLLGYGVFNCVCLCVLDLGE